MNQYSSLEEKKSAFLARTTRTPNGCLEWIGSRQKKMGHGSASFNGKSIGAHRLSYILFVGPIPAAKLVCHKCDNPPCVEPSHLFIGTYMDNNRDCVQKNRHARGDTNGARTKPHRISRGVQCWNAKLDEEKVRHIFRSSTPNIEIAKEYGVRPVTIRYIRKGLAWKHVTGGLQ